jgi:hypothetical protein
METNLIYELVGYAASLLVAISLMMSAIVKLRIVNMIGALAFTLYGVLIGSIPVAAMNAFIVFVNIYYLIKIYRDKTYFELLPASGDNSYLQKFLDFYRESIRSYQPSFSFSDQFNFSLFVLNKMVPVGLLMGHRDGSELKLELDFVIPSHRDFKVGNFMFDENRDYFRDQGIQTVVTSPGNEHHNRYLEKMGFSQINGSYVLNLDAEK